MSPADAAEILRLAAAADEREHNGVANGWTRALNAGADALDQLSAAQAEVGRLRARVAELNEALRLLDPRNASELFERIATDFFRATGMLAIGKDSPLYAGRVESEQEESDRRAAWRKFVNEWHERFFSELLKK